MNKKLYVGNLSFDAQEATLKELFEADGRKVIKVQIITERETGRSRGFGFVEMENEGDAQKAIEALNGKECNGRALTVNEAKEQVRNGGGGSRGGYGDRPSGGFGGNRGNNSRW
jgi:RNA recognition motif-containing protein